MISPIGIPAAAGLAPSLHLNLGDGYRRQGRMREAGDELAAGLAASGSLSDDGYGAMVRSGLQRLADRLDDRLDEASDPTGLRSCRVPGLTRRRSRQHLSPVGESGRAVPEGQPSTAPTTAAASRVIQACS